MTSTATRTSCSPVPVRTPPSRTARTSTSRQSAATYAARQEAPGGGLSGARAEPGRGVPGDAGRRPCPRTEAGEDEGDEAGEEQQAALTAIPAVVACHVVSGEADFLVEIAVPDLAAYEQVLLDEVLAIGPVRDVRSTFAIRTVLSRGPLPVDHRRLGG
ncbi:Lrp/AsnC ligand binding domain-containing protein [Streptomyces albidoflavus]